MTAFTRDEKYTGERQQLATIPNWHGLLGHINAVTPDHKRKITGYGSHDRVVVFHPDGSELYCRVDHGWKLRSPTESEILAIARSNEGCNLRGKWKLSRIDVFEDGSATEYFFTRA